MNGRRPAPGSGTPLVVLRRRWRLVAMAALLGLAVAVVWSVWRMPIYESTASVLVSPTATPTGGEDSHGQLSMRDERQMVRSVAVASIITRRFRTSTTPEQLLRQVSVETSAESRVLRITFTDPVPATARTGADA
ncbi:MAG: YveK family protein, partial [Actinomycetes bacterium]